MKNSLSYLKNLALEFPEDSGIYLMRDIEGKVIYIGKAKNIRKRVLSYFVRNGLDKKVTALMQNVSQISYLVTETEVEALLLEEKFIKKFRPKYNILLRDDKSYPLVKVSGMGKDVLHISIVRRKGELDTEDIFFGPYPNVKLLRLALRGLRFIYPFRSCYSFRKKCIYTSIGLCAAPCVRNVSDKERAYIENGVLRVLNGDVNEVVEKLFSRMQEASLRLDFESAAFFRDAAIAMRAVFGNGVSRYYGLLAVYELRDSLGLEFLPRRIEGFDISNVFGKYAVGSLVSFWNGEPDKKNYRRYKIKSVEGINDVGMIYEVIKRRCKRLSREEYEVPDLMLIDGGKAQLNAARRAIMEMGMNICVIALAKREELIFMQGKKSPVRLSGDSSALDLLKFVRDEAHRFALNYHRNRRKKGLIS